MREGRGGEGAEWGDVCSHDIECRYDGGLFLQLMGVVSLAIGLWLYITLNEYATFSNGERLLGSVFLLATGVGVIIAGFLGIIAALWESRIIATMVSYTSNPNIRQIHLHIHIFPNSSIGVGLLVTFVPSPVFVDVNGIVCIASSSL